VKGMNVLFVTTPSTQKELDSIKEFKFDPLPACFKNEFAVGQIGQVQFVKEAAGKLRTFAMVDV
jgi:hypothetical protein